jgi:hypothetical protein
MLTLNVLENVTESPAADWLVIVYVMCVEETACRFWGRAEHTEEAVADSWNRIILQQSIMLQQSILKIAF